MIDVQIYDTIRIHTTEGDTITVYVTDVIEMIRQQQGLPLLRPVSEHKSCPNNECEGGWAPDLLTTGHYQCPMCKTTWEVE